MAEATTDMDGETPEQTPSEEALFPDARRKKLREWIGSKNPILGSLYEGAVSILYSDPPLPGWPHFTSHAVREIRNRLPDAVAGTESVSRVDYAQEVKKISEVWNLEGLQHPQLVGTEEVSTSTTVTWVVPQQIYESLSRMVSDNSEVGDRKYRTAYRLFQALVPEGEFDDKDPIIKQWIEITDWFANSERTHVGGQDLGEYTDYTTKFEMVEHILLGLIESSEDFSQLPAELNEILENTNK